jgi:hypothetical protein
METKEEKLWKELYQVAYMLERARKTEAMIMFSEKQHLQKEMERVWDLVGPRHPYSFQIFKLLKASENRYTAFITGKTK